MARTVVDRVDRLQRLAAFESAARLGSFSAAGRELGIAQPAVTRQVRALERSLGVELFERSSNRVHLSEAGRTLLAAVDSGFAAIEVALTRLASLDDTFVLAMPPGFAQQLVVPDLDGLQTALGDRDLRLWLYDRDSELKTGEYHAAVRIGSTAWTGHEHHVLFAETVRPIAAPGLATELGLDESSSAADILAAPLLHMDARDRPWVSWSDWLAEFDLELTPGRRRVELNNYPTVVQQALAGRGVALGWSGLIEDFVAAELLVALGPELTTDRNYVVTWPIDERDAAIDSLIAWLG